MHEPATIRVVSAEIQRDAKWLICQRSARAVLPLLWEFPGGRVRPGESDADALERAVQSRVGVRPRVGGRLLEVAHDYPDYRVVLAVYRCTIDAGDEPWAENVAALAWVGADELADYPFPGADQHTVGLLLREG